MVVGIRFFNGLGIETLAATSLEIRLAVLPQLTTSITAVTSSWENQTGRKVLDRHASTVYVQYKLHTLHYYH